jgi:hypothetical protein
MARLILPYQSVFDLNGDPLPGAKMYFYESGTVTPKDTYSDEALTTPNTNPVIADSQGQFGDIFLSGAYSCKLTDSDDVTQPDYPAEIEAAADTSSTVLLTGAQTIAGVKTFTDRTANKANTPIYELEENDGSSNNRMWQFVAIAEQFIFRVANDVRDTFGSIFTVDRTGTTIDTVNFLSTNLQHNSNAMYAAIDEDDMASDSAVRVPTQQSVKKYVDDNTAGLSKILDMGAWNMDTITGISVGHGLTLSNIRSVSAMIRNDAGTEFYQALGFAGAEISPVELYIEGIDATNITVKKRVGGFFDGSVDFDATSNTINNAAAVDKGGGLVGIPITAHTFAPNDVTTITGTTNYDGTYTIVSETTNEIVITATYVSEIFAGTETASWSRGWIRIIYIA